jgi:tRNA pseudouridine38-40 synthase
MGAGRTDTGVHASEMFAHFDYEDTIDSKQFVHKINSTYLKILLYFDVFVVSNEAHTRFDATKRTYEYHINTFKDPFSQELSWYFHQQLDLDLMNKASQLFNHTNFQSFSR